MMTEYRTVSIPERLAKDMKKLMEEIGWWPSLSSFVREACHEKLYAERIKKRASIMEEKQK